MWAPALTILSVFQGEIWQAVEDKNIAWHCGAKSYRHPECRNSNSIGIELCVRNKGSQADTSHDWYFEDATVQAAIDLTKERMKTYQIPADREWLLINHHWYLFGHEGFMLTGWQNGIKPW